MDDYFAANDFDEFIRAARADNSGALFERGCQWLLTHVEPYASQLVQVWLWRDWPHQWGGDHGIDLVAESRTGERWAIQAKAYAATTRITKAHLDKFVAEASGEDSWGRSVFAHRLLIATTDRMDQGATRLCHRVGVQTIMHRDLRRLPGTWPDPERLRAPVKVRQRPRPHQEEAIKAVVDAFTEQSLPRAQLVMATGSGKTLVSLRAAEQLKSRKCLVLVPSLGLLAQTLRYWTTNRRRAHDFEVVAVCSDQTASVADDFPAAHASDVGYPTTTNSQVIADALSRDTATVVFSTYQSLGSVANASKLAGVPFDLLIADEAHRCAGPEQGIYARALDDERLPAHHRLFMTATPRHYAARARARARARGVPLQSMDDERVFGPVVHRFGFRAALDAGLICDYRIVVIQCHRTALRHVRERWLIARDGAANTDAESLALQVVALKAMRDHDLRRMVTFHARTGDAQTFSRSIADVAAWLPHDERLGADVLAEHIDGNMPTAKRSEILRRFETGDSSARRVLSNVRCLCEGIDVPPADAVVLADPQHSHADMLQAVSRALRQTPGKTEAIVLIPLVVPDDAPPDYLPPDSAFKPLLQAVDALRHHDDRSEKIEQLRFAVARGATTTVQRPGAYTVVVDAPLLVDAEYARKFNALLRKKVDMAAATAGNEVTKPRSAFSSEPAEQPDWSSPETLQRGLSALKAKAEANGGMLGRVDRYRLGTKFPLPTWWAGTLHVWQNGQLEDAHDAKREIAQLVSWLDVDAGVHPVVRAELAKLCKNPVPAVIEAWLDAHRQDLTSALREFQRRKSVPKALTIAALHKLLASPADPSEVQVSVTLRAASAVGPEMPYGEHAAQQFADGFREGLKARNRGAYWIAHSSAPYDRGFRIAANLGRIDL